MSSKTFQGYMQIDLEGRTEKAVLTGDWLRHHKRILSKPRHYHIKTHLGYTLCDVDTTPKEECVLEKPVEYDLRLYGDEQEILDAIFNHVENIMSSVESKLAEIGKTISWLADFSYVRIKTMHNDQSKQKTLCKRRKRK